MRALIARRRLHAMHALFCTRPQCARHLPSPQGHLHRYCMGRCNMHVYSYMCNMHVVNSSVSALLCTGREF